MNHTRHMISQQFLGSQNMSDCKAYWLAWSSSKASSRQKIWSDTLSLLASRVHNTIRHAIESFNLLTAYIIGEWFVGCDRQLAQKIKWWFYLGLHGPRMHNQAQVFNRVTYKLVYTTVVSWRWVQPWYETENNDIVPILDILNIIKGFHHAYYLYCGCCSFKSDIRSSNVSKMWVYSPPLTENCHQLMLVWWLLCTCGCLHDDIMCYHWFREWHCTH